jgi:uncharacterized protein (TIGR04222 family)
MLSPEIGTMNPFDLRGPEFLLFYIILSAIAIGLLALARHMSESTMSPRMDLGDPYLIAYLRGGKDEVLRVAIISLVDRRLLSANGSKIKRAKKATPDSVRKPLDRAILEKFPNKAEAASVFQDSSLGSIAEQYREPLKALRIIPDEAVTSARTMRFLIALFFLIGVGGIKIVIALERGRTNIFFLIVLMILFVLVARKVAFPRLTRLGADVLKDVQSLYGDLKRRAASIRPGGATIEAAMLAAVFGVGALPGDSFAFTRGLFPKAQGSSGTGHGSSSGSCGSSCGSSGGSSCGGGGCGGGCGGCGS